jgi:hypothetical protein
MEKAMIKLLRDILVDIYLMVRHPRQWWHLIRYYDCRYCGKEYKTGQQMIQHKITAHGKTS